MFQGPRKRPLWWSATALCAVGAALAGQATAASAAAPASVTVRVEGVAETRLPPTAVTTTLSPVQKDADPQHACSGTSAAGALELATKGGWSGPWFNGLGYSVESILGESHPFEEASPANYFWSFWLDNRESTTGICQTELQDGDQLLFFPACFGPACPPEALPLGIDAPARAGVGEAVTVTVRRYSAGGQASPVANATVYGAGAPATTDAAGHAVVSFPAVGEALLHAVAPESVRAEAWVCVHNGADGNCGTTLPGASTLGGSWTAPAASASGAAVTAARIVGIRLGTVYPRRHGPRVLRGVVRVAAGATLRDVSMRLQRRHGRRCFSFSGAREGFMRDRSCRPAAFFSVGRSASFSYLLPARLPAGRYAFDIRALDAAGHLSEPVAGVSHVVFRVR